jgi:tricarballylate dehydrogenase
MSGEESCDVVVIGAGSSAFEAAIAAKEAGAGRVVMLEKAPQSERGGNARFSHVGFRFVHSGADELREFMPDLDEAKFRQMHLPAYTAVQFDADLKRVTQGRIDPVLCDFFVEKSNEAVRWLRDIGVAWEHDTCTKIGDRYFFEPGIHIHPQGGGPGLLNRLQEIALKQGIEIRFETRVAAIHGTARAVQGVSVSAPDRDYDIAARAVIVCSGGFQASPEMRARYLGANADLVKVRGSKHDTGEVLQMLLALGARSSGHWQGAHMSPIDGKAPSFETPVQADGRGNSMNRYDYPFGITVNALGLRFYDEGENKHAYTYAKTGHAVMHQPGGVAYQIYDQKGIRLFRHGRDYPTTHVEADTLAGLAGKIGVEAEVLEHTVAEYNAACRTDIDFDPTKLDGRCTVGITPKKSNWAEPLTEAPFRALPVSGGVTFTFGGVQVNTDAQVLNSSNETIRGLYASGDVMGLFFHNYPSCTGQTRNAVFSRVAGRHAAALGN